jgi:hypothetical protein
MTDREGAPTDKVWAIYYLYAQQFPVTISLDQRKTDDESPYSVTIGENEETLTRLSDDEVSWLIRRKVGIR